MATATCSHCGGMRSFNKGRMGPNGWETYYETCGVCNGRGTITVPDPPPPPPPPKRARPPKQIGAGGNTRTESGPNDYVVEPLPPTKSNSKPFEFWFAFATAVGFVWLLRRGGAEFPWWGWLIAFFVPLLAVNSLLIKRPKLKKTLEKLVALSVVLAIVFFIVKANSGGAG